VSRRKEPRRLTEDEHALWQRVADSTDPLHPERKAAPSEPAAPHPVRAEKPVRGDRAETAIPSFRIGERADGKTPGHDLAAPLGDRLAKRPVTMDKRTHARMSRGKLTPEARLDLHGMTLDQAHPALVSFILSAQATGKRLVLVITGKGRQARDEGPIPARRGLLKHHVPGWLSAPPLTRVVLQVSEAHQSHGGSGAYYVYLRRQR